MRLFWELSKLSFQRQLTYRAAALAGLSTNFFFGIMRAALLVALYGAQKQVAGMTVADAITYTGLTQALIAFLSLFGSFDVMNSVYSGEIAADLLKPLDYVRLWLARDLGRAIANLLMRSLTIMLFYALYFKISVPKNEGQWAALGLALALGWLLSFAWRFLSNLPAFWTPYALGVGRFAWILSYFMSGFLLPLRFFPDWFQKLAYLTPFPHTVNTIVEVYLGLLTGTDLLREFLFQLLWIVGMIAGCYLVLRAGVRRLVILGG
jgi:ABC-2 type transport system permease protein